MISDRRYTYITKSNGYKDAPVIINGKLEQDVGGGVCQVSTTIYNAALIYNPGEFDLYYNLGIVYTRLSDFQMAKEMYEKYAVSLRIFPIRNHQTN